MHRLEYNATDCAATRLIFDEINPQHNDMTRRVYEAEMGLQGPCLAVQMRGIKVDETKRREIVAALKEDVAAKTEEIAKLVGRPLSKFVGSPKQIAEFMYNELGLRVQKNTKTGNVSTDDAALQKIAKRGVPVDSENLPRDEVTRRKDTAAAVAVLILECRDLGKQASSLSEALIENGRMRTTITSGGTESYRFSSSKACTGKGFNQQNVDKRLRGCFVPDDGFIMVQMDQTTAESMVVAYDSQDENYIAAHLGGNTHVDVAKFVWPNLPWPADKKAAKAWAKETTLDGGPPHGRNTYYDKAKEVQHASNYVQTAQGLAVRIGVSIKEAERIQAAYFGRFPGIKQWHKRVIDEVKRYGSITCPGGFRHLILGRRWDSETHRQAISRIPQGIVAWQNHITFSRLFYELDGVDFQVLGHIHDAVLFQVREKFAESYVEDGKTKYRLNAEMAGRIEEQTNIVWPMHGRAMRIPFEIKTGYNWSEIS